MPPPGLEGDGGGLRSPALSPAPQFPGRRRAGAVQVGCNGSLEGWGLHSSPAPALSAPAAARGRLGTPVPRYPAAEVSQRSLRAVQPASTSAPRVPLSTCPLPKQEGDGKGHCQHLSTAVWSAAETQRPPPPPTPSAPTPPTPTPSPRKLPAWGGVRELRAESAAPARNADRHSRLHPALGSESANLSWRVLFQVSDGPEKPGGQRAEGGLSSPLQTTAGQGFTPREG